MSEKLRQTTEDQELEQLIENPEVLGEKILESASKKAKGHRKKHGLLSRKSKIEHGKEGKKKAKDASESENLEMAEDANAQTEGSKVEAEFYEKVLGDYLEASKNESVQNLVNRTMEILNQEARDVSQDTPEPRVVELGDIFNTEMGEYEEYGDEYYEEETEDVVSEENSQSSEVYEDEEDDGGDWDLYSDNRMELYENEHKFQLYQLPENILRRYPFIEELPERIAIMGGMARSIAREIVTGESKNREAVRDIDLVNIIDNDGSCYVSPGVRDQLSAEYMPDVFEQGQRMNNDTLEHYFDSRDFTVNQALIMNGQLILSNAAKNDFQENIVRPSHFEKPRESSWLKSSIAMKALFMKAVTGEFTKTVPTLEDLTFGQVFPADVADYMDRAMERGIEVMHAYTRELAEWGIIPSAYAGQPMAAAKIINQQVQNEATSVGEGLQD